MKTFANFDEFYSYYLASHSNVWNRRVHLLGWVLGVAGAIWALSTLTLWAIPVAVVVGLGIALLGHAFVEKNDSVVFSYPMWTTCADIRMFSDMLNGRIPC
jgi:hypothetical protein